MLNRASLCAARDHPHTRGEYHSGALPFLNVVGSPPHTWGIPQLALRRLEVDRITPTHVGNTQWLCLPHRHPEDHPHTRGEYHLPSFRYQRPPGSPPHTWGIQMFEIAENAVSRITPTHVGNTHPSGCGAIATKDHPHTRGEYNIEVTSQAMTSGSPPHTWGILATVDGTTDSIRITPTHVGNTIGMQIAGRTI
ncbi:hypothetical protein FD12_GL002554 [Lentilactobacillus rapi DSM 19907 = JCM 15042]|uniref:Uncharacterized protein n=1 Tax=Lentilactobacillus rapi DSM 19907 = JCM 15042 TaxID=1423795 RepID=A0ABR5PDV9_9LACO|nr:hypothetical protein FD12_GL002554 [Lentilactobacillus rapi DSM 19907 = JCM 15042]